MKVFAVEHPVDILIAQSYAVYAWLLGDNELCSRCITSEKFS
ncbi:hypothetical protein [Campylobacter concisus]|nr:hypothetical protein [Campylobacter concisus]